ncbi:hypothetical protein Clacol_002060 [Clathrus columnatus]|uniref:Cytochrome P450 n=1 Tax=Clathrus columnatus TaxID=1419009 RepID=A0AAV5A515_9AGAM|nr:hypothetical protein Clacol_002060 [Clathrus columnatus]
MSSFIVSSTSTSRVNTLLVVVGFLAFATIYKLLDKRKQFEKRPPLVKYTIPWLGSAIQLGKDPDGVFKNATKAFGPVFRIKAAGREFTYITAPEIISAVYRDSKTFEFTPIRLDMSELIFGISKKSCNDMKNIDHFLKYHHEGLSAKAVHGLHQRYGPFAYDCIQNMMINFRATTITKLALFIKPPAYVAALYTFFGKTYPALESYEPFQIFDAGFLLLQTKLPRFILRKYLNAREKLTVLTEGYLTSPHEDCSDFVREMEGLVRNEKWSSRDMANFFLGDIWAFESNAIQAVYWIIALQLQRPEGLYKIIEEIDTARDSWIKNNSNVEDETHCQWILEGSFPFLTSVIQESLRFCSSVFSIRLVTREVTLGGYRIRKGDYVMCHTRSVHMDNDIHKNPTEFIPERYMGSETFTKNGRIVPNHSMPFGGGVSMCEGRHFVMGELKIFIALLLSAAHIELDPLSSERPQFQWARMGTGLMPPEGDLFIRVTRRTSTSSSR